MTPDPDGLCYACGKPPGGAGRAAALILLCAAFLAGGVEAALHALPGDAGGRQPTPPPAGPAPAAGDGWGGRVLDELARRERECAELRRQNQAILAQVDQLKEERKGGQAAAAALERQVRSLRWDLEAERLRQQEKVTAHARRARFAEELASLYKSQWDRSRRVPDRLARELREEGPDGTARQEEEQPGEVDPRLKAGFIRVAEKMKQDADARAWARLELYEREQALEVIYKFVYFRYHRGNGLFGLSAKEVGLLRRAGLAGYVRMEEARRRPASAKKSGD